MSLQLAAQHLASKGRGKDSRLVHMTPNELKGLQSLAKAKGGSLTINPETGLPEAGFLEDVLPIAATAATMAFFPAAAPALGGMFGASGALATGLGAGLMAGGYNLLGQALGGQQMNLGKALTSGAITGVTAGALQGLGAYTPTADVATKTAATTTAPLTAAQAIDATPAFAYTPSGEMVSSAYPASVTGAVNTAGVVPPPPAGVGPAAATGLTGGQKLALGLGGVGALSLLGSRGPKLQPFQPGSAGQIRPYEFTATPTMATPYPSPYSYNAAGMPVTSSSERQYFDMGYTALPPYNAAQGGLMMAYGGPVERMSAMDQQRGMYPMGMMDKTYYATPTQRPASMEVVRSDYDTPVNPITGIGQQFAKGGEVKGYAAGGMPDFGNGYNPYANLPPISGPLGAVGGQRPTGMQPIGVSDGINPFSPERMAVLRNDPKFLEMQRVQGGGYDAQGRPVNGLGNLINQPTGQSTFSRSAFMQNGFGQSAQGYPSFTMGSGGGGNSGGPFPLEGQYGIVKMNTGGSTGGEYNLGSYSDGGRLLKGPGDGMSDNIPAMIGKKQPARLADGEFVVPADVVSHLGNGSTDAGAKRLYAMMDKVRKARTGNKKQGKEIKAEKYLPA